MIRKPTNNPILIGIRYTVDILAIVVILGGGIWWASDMNTKVGFLLDDMSIVKQALGIETIAYDQ